MKRKRHFKLGSTAGAFLMATHFRSPSDTCQFSLNMKDLHSPHRTIGHEVSQKRLGHSRINSCLKKPSVRDYWHTQNPSIEEEAQEDPEVEAMLGYRMRPCLKQTSWSENFTQTHARSMEKYTRLKPYSGSRTGRPAMPTRKVHPRKKASKTYTSPQHPSAHRCTCIYTHA